MNTFDITNIVVADLVFILKGFYILGMLMYLVFAVLVVKQVQVMRNSLGGLLSLPVLPLAILHLIFAVICLLSVVVFL